MNYLFLPNLHPMNRLQSPKEPAGETRRKEYGKPGQTGRRTKVNLNDQLVSWLTQNWALDNNASIR